MPRHGPAGNPHGKGGRIPPDGRPPQAKGVGKNAKRHDLERPPPVHGSDLQYGDRKRLEQGMKTAPAQTQERGGAPQIARQTMERGGGTQTSSMQVPDAIDFLAKKNGSDFNPPQYERRIDASKAMTWLPILRRLASGPGASAALVNAFINQARLMQQAGGQPATIVDMNATDDGIEEMLKQGIR